MTIGMSFLCGLLASSVSYFMLGLWWPVALLVGGFAWLAFGLLDVKMNSTFTLLGGMLLIFCVSLSAMVLRANDQLSGLQFASTQDEEGNEFRYPVPLLGQARYGEKIYKASGCVACHTQQVTHESVELDVKAMAGEKNHAAAQEAVSRFYRATGRRGVRRGGAWPAGWGVGNHRDRPQPGGCLQGPQLPRGRRCLGGCAGAVPRGGPHAE